MKMDTLPEYYPLTSTDDFMTFPSEMQFNVFYLESIVSPLGQPLLEEEIITVTNPDELNIYHGGLGFISVQDPTINFTIDYALAQGFGRDTLLPEISVAELLWRNQTQVSIGSFIDPNYWVRSNRLATITGAQLFQLQEWILNVWIPENPIYVLFAGVVSTRPGAILTPIMRSSNCYDFVNNAVIELSQLQVEFDFLTPPLITASFFLQPSPDTLQPVSFSPEIVDFYLRFIQFVDQRLPMIDLTQLTDREQFVIENEHFSPIQVAQEAYLQFQTIYIYGYHPDGSLGYWRIQNPVPTVRYLPIPIPAMILPPIQTSPEETPVNFWPFLLILLVVFLLVIIALILYWVSSSKAVLGSDMPVQQPITLN